MLSIEMEGLDPENNRFDLFFVDGASNVQGAGEVVEGGFFQVRTIHGSEHFFISYLKIFQRCLR